MEPSARFRQKIYLLSGVTEKNIIRFSAVPTTFHSFEWGNEDKTWETLFSRRPKLRLSHSSHLLRHSYDRRVKQSIAQFLRKKIQN